MKIIEMCDQQREEIRELSEKTGVKISKLSIVIMHHGLIRLKKRSETQNWINTKHWLEGARIAYMPKEMKNGFWKLHEKTGENVSVLYSNAIEIGIRYMKSNLGKLEQNPFISFG